MRERRVGSIRWSISGSKRENRTEGTGPGVPLRASTVLSLCTVEGSPARDALLGSTCLPCPPSLSSFPPPHPTLVRSPAASFGPVKGPETSTTGERPWGSLCGSLPATRVR